LTDVALDWAPASPPPLLVGAVRERTVALAGECADGVIFTGETAPDALREALPHLHARRPSTRRVAPFAPVNRREVGGRIG
ncbi:MAG: LLM class flavin-dependent oxidoreductase, partial [Gaiellaceae bacterium]